MIIPSKKVLLFRIEMAYNVRMLMFGMAGYHLSKVEV